MFALFLTAMFQGPSAKVGPLDGHSAFLNTGQVLAPYGWTVEFKGRPVDMRVLPNDLLAVKDMQKVRIFNLATLSQTREADLPGGASPTGMAATRDGKSLYVTNAENGLYRLQVGANGNLQATLVASFSGPQGPKDFSFPCGIALSTDEQTAYVCLSRDNALAVVDLNSGRVLAQIPTGVSPFEVAIANGKAYVTNQGGRRPLPGEAVSDSAGTDVAVDSRGIAATGTVTVVDLGQNQAVREIRVGLQPCAIVTTNDRKFAYVANANGDTVSVLDLRQDREYRRVDVKPDSKLPFGSMPDGLALSPDGRRLYVDLAGNNAVALLDSSRESQPRPIGFIPAGWYPAAVAETGGKVLVLDNKGVGRRILYRPIEKGINSHDQFGGLQEFPILRGMELTRATSSVYDLRNAPSILAAYARSAEGDPAPVPAHLGLTSSIKHVVYVIKENRSYDQVFGDIGKGDGDPKLTTFGERVTPNEHALARQFVLLDNYYCNSVLSADGHSWATEGNVTPYLNRDFGGFNRTYTFGNDPITYSSTGFIWDAVLAAGLSFRNYGEMWSSDLPKGLTAQELRAGHRAGKTFDIPSTTGIDTIKRYSCLDFPGWDLDIPDQYRIERFLKEFEQDKRDHQFPNFVIVYLPQDHTGGPLGPEADVADNDLAVGRLVDAISHSEFWKDTAIFVNEDDPQNGFDHVDGHRSICMVVSPYTQSGRVVGDFYNQCSVLHTIEQILGLAPLNQKVAAAPLMTACFDAAPNLAPYEVKPAQIDLHEVSPKITGRLARWRRALAKLDLRRHEVQTAKDMDILNRAIWDFTRGRDPYPARYVGGHGAGLAKRGLRPDKENDDGDGF